MTKKKRQKQKETIKEQRLLYTRPDFFKPIFPILIK